MLSHLPLHPLQLCRDAICSFGCNSGCHVFALNVQAADATKGAASKADSKTPNPGDIADKAKKSLPFGYMNIGDLAFDLPGSGVSKDDLPNNVKPGDAQGLPKGPTAQPPSIGNPKALDQVLQ